MVKDPRCRTWRAVVSLYSINPLTPNDPYSGRTALLTSKVAFYIFIQQIYVLNILNAVYTLRYSSSKCRLFHNSNVFGSCIIHVLYTECAKIKVRTPRTVVLSRRTLSASFKQFIFHQKPTYCPKRAPQLHKHISQKHPTALLTLWRLTPHIGVVPHC